MTTSNTAVTTIRINLAEAGEIAQSGFILPSDLKDNWAKFSVVANDALDTWRRKGAHVTEMGIVHVSLTGMSTDEMAKAGLVDPLHKAMDYLRPSVMTRVKVKEVLPGLWILSAGDMCENHTFVVAESRDEIKAAILAARATIERNSVLWAKWSKDANWISHEGRDIAKMPNGLSVAFGLDGYCQSGYNEIYEAHATMYDFYNYLTKFF